MTDLLVEHRQPHGVLAPRGQYSHAAILHDRSARLCFVGGQVGYDLDGGVPPTLQAQMEQVFANLSAVLADAGASLSSVLQLTTYLVDTGDIDAYFATRGDLFPRLFPNGYPPNALIVVHALARPTLLIEVQAVAAIPG
jgi:enamine deaminase RidA (YjgF/YER057c/UK114 family)